VAEGKLQGGPCEAWWRGRAALSHIQLQSIYLRTSVGVRISPLWGFQQGRKVGKY
jgi:hypothetical protein